MRSPLGIDDETRHVFETDRKTSDQAKTQFYTESRVGLKV